MVKEVLRGVMKMVKEYSENKMNGKNLGNPDCLVVSFDECRDVELAVYMSRYGWSKQEMGVEE